MAEWLGRRTRDQGVWGSIVRNEFISLVQGPQPIIVQNCGLKTYHSVSNTCFSFLPAGVGHVACGAGGPSDGTQGTGGPPRRTMRGEKWQM